jgi:hypothetical protein
MPGYHLGRIPRNKGQRCPADPPRTEEIVAVMRRPGHQLFEVEFTCSGAATDEVVFESNLGSAVNVFTESGGDNPDFSELKTKGQVRLPARRAADSFHVQANTPSGILTAAPRDRASWASVTRTAAARSSAPGGSQPVHSDRGGPAGSAPLTRGLSLVHISVTSLPSRADDSWDRVGPTSDCSG